MVEYFDSYHFHTTKIKEGSIEWTINSDGVLYVNCDSTIVYPPFLEKGKYSLSFVTEREFKIDVYSYLYIINDGILDIYKDAWYGSTCTFKKKQ